LQVLTALLRKPPRAIEAAHAATLAAEAAAAQDAAATVDVGYGAGVDGDGDGEGDGGGELTTAQGGTGGSTHLLAGGGARLGEAQLRWLLNFVSVHLDDNTMQVRRAVSMFDLAV